MAKVLVRVKLASLIQRSATPARQAGGGLAAVEHEPHTEVQEFTMVGYEPKEAAEVLADTQADGTAIVLALGKKDGDNYSLFVDTAHLALEHDNAELTGIQSVLTVQFSRRTGGSATRREVVSGDYPVKLEPSDDMLAIVNSQPLSDWLLLMTATPGANGRPRYRLFRTDKKQGGHENVVDSQVVASDDCFNRPTAKERLECLAPT
jgi:hypothetical protein